MKYLKSIYENLEGYAQVAKVLPVAELSAKEVWRNWVYYIANNLAEMKFNDQAEKLEFKKYKRTGANIAEFKDDGIYASTENIEEVKKLLREWKNSYPRYVYFEIM
jgi:hypothetical protein